jgi:hypothetical protein
LPATLDQLLSALQLKRRIDLRRLCLGEVGLLLVDGRFVGVLLDPKQQIALLDHLPFGEIALFDEARHSRDDVDLVDRHDTADIIAGVRDLADLHRFDRNGRRRRGILRGRRAAAKGQDKPAPSRCDAATPAPHRHPVLTHRP